MEFIESFKLTDIERVEREGLDRKDLAKRVADTFLYQIVDTAYFCDPHPGNLAVDTKGNLVYYDFGMMDRRRRTSRRGSRSSASRSSRARSRRPVVLWCLQTRSCPSHDAGVVSFSSLRPFGTDRNAPHRRPHDRRHPAGREAKQLVDAVETAGVLAKGADRLSSEQLARYFIRAFKDKQLGKDRSDGPGIKSTLGTELQALTESQVFRFPSTFTFIFRAIASIDGIGKGLDEDYDLGEFAQPFVTKLKQGQVRGRRPEKVYGCLREGHRIERRRCQHGSHST